MLLKNLFKDSGEKLETEFESIDIEKLQYDSRKIKKGDLFFAVRGYQEDGHNYLQQAYENGANAAIVEKINPDIPLKQIIVENCRIAMARLAYSYYKPNLEKLDLIGITGTNGKTTCSYLIQSVLEAAGISCGLAGTIHYIIGSKRTEAWNTTPEAIDLYQMLAQMQQAGNKACVLEVSSHALALNRVEGLKFKVAVFTNLSRDHMDFHPDMESYFTEKSKLFNQLSASGTAVINNDDPYGRRLLRNPGNISFGVSKESHVNTTDWSSTADGTTVYINTPKGKFYVNSQLIGDFNIYNILTAVSVALTLDISLQDIKMGIKNLQKIPGRLETYRLKNGALAVIDYAHTPDALEKALNTIRKITQNKLIVVFGCGGDRDKGKRPEMGKIAQQLADVVYVTDDNPRTESSLDIIKEILAGMEKAESVHTITKRQNAIKEAIKSSQNGDAVLIAGKGHETYQVIGKTKHVFNEVEIIQEVQNYA